MASGSLNYRRSGLFLEGALLNTAKVKSARRVALAVIALGALATLCVNLPGHLSFDSVLQLYQGRTGVYNSWHPPIMAWLLGLADAVTPGAGFFVVFDWLLLFGSLAWLLALPDPRRGSWAAPVIAAACMISPLWLIYPGIVWKDVLFAACSLAGFTALAQAAAWWPKPRRRLLLIGLAVVLMALAGLARQTGAVVPIFGAIALAIIASGAAPRGGMLRGAGYGLGAFAAATAIMVGSTLALDTRSDGEPARLYQMEDLQIFDLAGAVSLRPELPLDQLRAANPRLEQLVRTDAADEYDPRRIDPLAALGQLHDAMGRTPPSVIDGQWRDLVFHHPDLYLAVRATDFYWVTLTPDIHECLPFFVGIDGPEPFMARLGLVQRLNGRDKLLKGYGDALTGTPAFSHALFGVVALFVLVKLVMRRRPPDIALAAMLLSALAFSASFLVVSVACDYRYLYVLDVSAMAAALYLAASSGPGGRGNNGGVGALTR